MADANLPTPPPLGAHEVFTARWGARLLVKLVLGLVMTAVFLILELGTAVPASIGEIGIVLICAVLGALLYVPLARAADAWIDRRVRELARRQR